MKFQLLRGMGMFAICLMFPHLVLASDSVRAFPGAEGFGAHSKGGRGGAIMYVTTLKDSGPGSLREACTASGPRIVLFKVSGIIALESPLKVTSPYLSVAGQTAPGDGICIKNYGFEVVRTHDIVIRYIRFRPGDERNTELDALTVDASQRVIIDHCSTSWGTDEVLSVVGGGATDITVQWCLITESLNNSVHRKGPHGYGSLFRLDGSLSVHHNLYASNSSRNPRPGCYGDMTKGVLLDFKNNVIYNWGIRAGYTAEDKASLNYVGNYLKPGPSTEPGARRTAFFIGGEATRMFLEDNHLEHTSTLDGDNWPMVKFADVSWTNDVRLATALPVAAVTTDGPEIAYARVLREAGATLPKRDSVDLRVVHGVFNNLGRIINSQTEVGGWPTYRSVEPLQDTDNDGMADEWEIRHCFDARNANDGVLDQDGDGYSNVEEFLNATDPGMKDS